MSSVSRIIDSSGIERRIPAHDSPAHDSPAHDSSADENLAGKRYSNTDLLAMAWSVAAAVADPELPFVTVEDLGILRSVTMDGDKVVAGVSPTYSGCPAVAVIERAILQALRNEGFNATVERVMSPAWTTDWITETGRQKLLQNGIAPPASDSNAKPALFAKSSVTCPHCSCPTTTRISEFGSTPCKAQYRCNECREPFDYFKCH